MQPSLALSPGTLLAGEFRVVRPLRDDTFAIVYEAESERFHTPVNIREFCPSEFTRRNTEQALLPVSIRHVGLISATRQDTAREWQALTSIDHPNIERIRQTFEANNTVYAVTARDDAPTLLAWADSLRRRPTQIELDRIARKLLAALEAVHGAGIFHCNITPETVLVRPGVDPLLSDFGAARANFGARSRTVHATVNSGYSAPELYLLSSGDLGPKTDVFGVAAVLYRLATGRSPSDVLARGGGGSLPAAAALTTTEYRTSFLAAIDAGMALEPRSRPATLQAWRDRLLSGADEALENSAARADPLHDVAAEEPGEIIAVSRVRTAATVQSRAPLRSAFGTQLWVGGAVLAGLIAGGFYLLEQPGFLGTKPAGRGQGTPDAAQRQAMLEADAQRKADAARARADAEDRRKAEEKRLADLEAARMRAEAEIKRKAEEETRRIAALETKRKDDADAKRRAELEQKRQTEDATRQQAEADAARTKGAIAETLRRASEQAEREAAAKRQSEADAGAKRNAGETQLRQRTDEIATKRSQIRARIAIETDRDALLELAASDTAVADDVVQRLSSIGYVKFATAAGAIWRKPGAGEAFRDCDSCPAVVMLPAGIFMRTDPEAGSTTANRSGTVRTIKTAIAASFAIGRTEVTRGQFAAFVAEAQYKIVSGCYARHSGWDLVINESWASPGYAQDDSHPVACVSWLDAQAYVRWLSAKTGQAYRLSTDREWEFAAQATIEPRAPSRYAFGDQAGDLCKYANVADVSLRETFPRVDAAQCTDGYVHTAPAGSFKPNAFGLFDMHGNVWEWVQSCVVDAPAGASPIRDEGCAPDAPRILRGGSWNDAPGAMRLEDRMTSPPDLRNETAGFRVARDLVP